MVLTNSNVLRIGVALMIGALLIATGCNGGGGVNSTTIAAVSRAGADVFVAGSAIFNTNDYRQAIDVLRSELGG